MASESTVLPDPKWQVEESVSNFFDGRMLMVRSFGLVGDDAITQIGGQLVAPEALMSLERERKLANLFQTLHAVQAKYPEVEWVAYTDPRITPDRAYVTLPERP